MNAETNDVYRMWNGRLIYVQKYCPKRWFHWKASTVVITWVIFFIAGMITWAFIAALKFPCPKW